MWVSLNGLVTILIVISSDECHVWSMSIDLRVCSSTDTYVALIPILFTALLVHKVNLHCSFWNCNY